VWLASRYQQAGASDRMAEHLAESAVWADGPVSRLPLDWVQGFVDARADAGDPPLDVFALTSDPSWQAAVRLRATALLERGAATGGSSVSRAVADSPSPPAVANVWRGAAPPDQLPAPVLDLSDALDRDYGRHRSGWALAIEALAPLHVDGGVRLDAFVEHTFFGPAPAYTSPWVGFLHNPADLPPWYPIDQSAGQLLRDARFQASLATCRGLFTLSTELREWWAARVDVPVVAVPYPTGPPELRFDIDSMKHNPVPRIVQVGTWLRKLHAVHQLPVRGLQRTIVHQHEHYIDVLFATERRALQLHVDDSCVETLPFLDHRAYDELLSCNLVFVELYAASATNVVVECMARATPILVNPLPAVREYLGDDYPLYFSSRTEAARKAEDLALVATAHDYLAGLPQAAQLGDACFVGAVSTSAIYRALAS
jgi:hypothetical protein